MRNSIAIVGAGLAGLMCALHLAQRGFSVTIYEKRLHREICAPNYRIRGQPGRSMSMDISSRGLYALESVDLVSELMKAAMPMKFKINHDIYGNLKSIPYGQAEHEQILTISRTFLYQSLLKRCFDFGSIKINFGYRLEDINLSQRKIRLLDTSSNLVIERNHEVLIGADGINSTVRELASAVMPTFFSTSHFPMSYKELSIPNDTKFKISVNAMHLWPRRDVMLVAQPNFDHSFTCALLMHESDKSFSYNSVDADNIRSMFDELFPDVSFQMPHLELEYRYNPVGKLKIISAQKWALEDFILLIGDAAHGMVPFFGQGVNCSFEDCTFIADTLDKYQNNWLKLFDEINQVRVKEAHAINLMSYENYPELFTSTDLTHTLLIKEVEAELSSRYPSLYRTYHNLVCFDRVPYTFAQKVKTLQTELLHRICADINYLNQLDVERVKHELGRYQIALSSLKKEN